MKGYENSVWWDICDTPKEAIDMIRRSILLMRVGQEIKAKEADAAWLQARLNLSLGDAEGLLYGDIDRFSEFRLRSICQALGLPADPEATDHFRP